MREGDRFEGYILKNKLAEGGMAEVFRAERVGLQGVTREVCIKRILPALSGDGVFVQMFIDEARIASTLRHSNIVAVEHCGIVDGVPFMALAWVHGIDANSLLRRLHVYQQRLPIDAALYLVTEVLRALEYAHGKTDERGQWLQIVHRDVSPHNMLISFAGEVALSDFGIAKATSRLHQTHGHVVKGKIAYMAPEQATGAPLDHRADLFAVGVIAFQLLTGRLPFGNVTDPLASTQALVRGDRPSVRGLRPEVPLAVEAFVDRLLQLMPDARYPDAGSARDALAAVPLLATGERSLQRLVRSLFADEVFSTISPGAQVATPFPVTVVDARPMRLAQQHSLDVTLPAAPTMPEPDGVTLVIAPHAGGLARPPAASTTAPFVAVSVAPPRSRSLPQIAPFALVFCVGSIGSAYLGALSARAPNAVTPPALAAPAVAPRAPSAPTAALIAEQRPAVVSSPVDAGAADADAQAPTDRPVAMASVQVVAVPWGSVSIDGRPLVENRATYRVPVGRHHLRAVCMGNVVVTRNVTLHAGANANELMVAPEYIRLHPEFAAHR